jgi:hypothetical protein
METKTQTQQCEQKRLDLRELANKIYEKLRQGVELSNRDMVAVNLSVYHFTYTKVSGNMVEVIYATGCVSVHVDALVADGDVEIKDVNLYNLCSDSYGV